MQNNLVISSIIRSFLAQLCIGLCFMSSYTLLVTEWALIWVNFDPIQKFGPNIWCGCSFWGGCSFAKLRTHMHLVWHTCGRMDKHPTKLFLYSYFERTHTQETWEKRVSYIQVVVELVGAASHQKKTHIQSYSDPISHLFQTAVDVYVLGMLQSAWVSNMSLWIILLLITSPSLPQIVITMATLLWTDSCTNWSLSLFSEPQEQGSVHVISMLQEILNLLNICSPSDNILQKILDLIFVVLEQMPNAHLLTLPTITAGEHEDSPTLQDCWNNNM